MVALIKVNASRFRKRSSALARSTLFETNKQESGGTLIDMLRSLGQACVTRGGVAATGRRPCAEQQATNVNRRPYPLAQTQAEA